MTFISEQMPSDTLGAYHIRSDTVVFDTVYDDSVTFSDLCTHRAVEIGLIVGGNGVHRILGNAAPCKEGDIYILNAGIPHRYFASEAGGRLTVRRILFDPKEWFPGDAGQAASLHYCHGVFADNALTACAMLTSRTREQIESLLNTVAIETVERKSEWKEAVRAHLSILLITLGRYVNRAIKNLPRIDTVEWTPVSAAIHAVKENFGDPAMTLESIAESFYISKAHFSRLFRQLTGEAFSEYLRKVRYSEACSLLTQTDLTVEEIVLRCGLRDTPTFYKTFHTHYGMTPNQYRITNRNKGEITMSILTQISEQLQKGKAKIVKELVQQALDEGVAPDLILNEGLLSGMNVI
ncbi:MAG: helix-turn-helix domain-containing protein, partial [Clostridia bacterium]|nr:helix-turn-helix domain-containing protein [Clostridia bacterium]